jgi:hypothetical protein
MMSGACLFAALAGLLLFGGGRLFLLVYAAVFVLLAVRTLLTPGQKRVKCGLIVCYAIITACQIVLAAEVLFTDEGYPIAQDVPTYWLRRAVCTVVILLPLVISRYIVVGKYARFYLPSVREAGTIGFSELKGAMAKAAAFAEAAGRTRQSLSPTNFREIFEDLPRHDSFRYVNEGTLADCYFEKAEATLTDPHIYIVLSCTGSPASEIISVFTAKTFNHASLAFDEGLLTILSYNGGDRVYPPGLNAEMLSAMGRKEGARVLVYSLPCTREQKALILDKVREINEDGSAYNMLGLVTKRSYRPNIMFCSQFVYRMLDLAGLAYFEKPDGQVQPTDFVEADYRRALSFAYEIEL